MTEDPQRSFPREDDPESSGIAEDSPQGGGESGIGGQGGEGEGAENLSPPIGQEGEPGRTEQDAPDEDAGAPSGEELESDE
jgi:hypothetical protein